MKYEEVARELIEGERELDNKFPSGLGHSRMSAEYKLKYFRIQERRETLKKCWESDLRDWEEFDKEAIHNKPITMKNKIASIKRGLELLKGENKDEKTMAYR